MYLISKPESEFMKAYGALVEQLTDDELKFEIGQVIIRKDDFYQEALMMLNQQFLKRGNK